MNPGDKVIQLCEVSLNETTQELEVDPSTCTFEPFNQLLSGDWFIDWTLVSESFGMMLFMYAAGLAFGVLVKMVRKAR